jgi:nucleoid-associated protein YgaU
MKLPWLVLLSFALVSCSGSKSSQKVSEESPQVELSDAEEFIENPADENATAATEIPDEDAVVADAAPAETVSPDEVTDDSAELTDDNSVTEAPVDSTEEVTISSDTGIPAESATASANAGSTMQYKVKSNETLMLIAFKLYGDYSKWKDLATANRDVLKGSMALRKGMVLSYQAPSREFSWNPQGLPYLIRTGDTLGTISNQVYTTPKKWKLIWDNNRPLIKDPNRIFAGFTLYYLENGREVASEI